MTNWRALFARDSMLWSCLFYIGLGVNIALPMMSNPADYGISPLLYKWLVLLNAVITAVAGKLGMSPVELARNQNPPKD